MPEHMSREECCERFDNLEVAVGAEHLLHSLFRWLPTDTLEKFIREMEEVYEHIL